jgi:hypothetical protein
MLIDMVDYLQNYLIENKTLWIESNLIRVYQTSLNRTSFKELQTHCEGIIKRNPKLIFEAKLFSTLKGTILLDLLKRDDEFLPEIEIWNYLITWVHEQEPPIDKDARRWNSSNTIEFERRIRDFVPHIRFFTISSECYYKDVRPYKDVLAQKLVNQLEKYYLVKGTSPPPDALPPRKRKRNPSIYFKQRDNIGNQSPTRIITPGSPGLQRITSFFFFLRLNFR